MHRHLYWTNHHVLCVVLFSVVREGCLGWVLSPRSIANWIESHNLFNHVRRIFELIKPGRLLPEQLVSRVNALREDRVVLRVCRYGISLCSIMWAYPESLTSSRNLRTISG